MQQYLPEGQRVLCRRAVDLKHTSDRVCVSSVAIAKFHDVLSYYEWVERLLPSDHVRKSGRDHLRAIACVKYKGYPFQSQLVGNPKCPTAAQINIDDG